jgi:cell wall assembly regulator SMI1
MAKKHSRVIGTTEDAIARAEKDLLRRFPPSFRRWLLDNNGLGIEGVTILPVLDDRDPRKTWDSIVRNYNVNWAGWLENFRDQPLTFDHLLPFAYYGTGDYYCFDYNGFKADGECPVVRWSHETGGGDHRADSFPEFEDKVRAGDFDLD